MKSGFETDFIDRTLKTTGWVLVVSLVFGTYYFGVYPALAFFSGGVWGMVNLLFINKLVRSTIKPGGVDTPRAIGLALVKFPFLYLAGYALLKVPQFEPLHLLAGFSLLLVIMVLKVAGRALLGLDDTKQQNGNLGSAL